MKILAEAVPNNTYAGFRAAAEHLGHQWVWWSPEHTPAFDVFDEVKPDLVFVMGSQNIAKCLLEYSPMVRFGCMEHPFRFYLPQEYVEIPTGVVDHHTFYPEPDDALRCTVAITASPSDDQAVNTAVYRICDSTSDVKVASESPWPIPQYIGQPSLHDKRRLYSSAKFGLATSVEDVCRMLACGCLPLVATNLDDLYGCDLLDATALYDKTLDIKTCVQKLRDKYLPSHHTYEHLLQELCK